MLHLLTDPFTLACKANKLSYNYSTTLQQHTCRKPINCTNEQWQSLLASSTSQLQLAQKKDTHLVKHFKITAFQCSTAYYCTYHNNNYYYNMARFCTWRCILMPVPRAWQKALYWTLVDQLPIIIPSRSFTCANQSLLMTAYQMSFTLYI